MPDPLRQIYGNPFEGAGRPVYSRGSVIAVRAGKCTVAAEDGAVFYDLDWPQVDQSPGGAGCTISPPQVGSAVILRRSPTGTYIAQSLPLISPVSESSGVYSLSDTPYANPSSLINGPAYVGSYPDALPGDRMWVGNQGQKVGILEGGAALLSASPWAGVRALQKDDTLQILGRNLEIQTGFGQIKFTDAYGKNSFVLEGGTDRLTETGTGMENWTVRMAMGQAGNGLVDCQFRTPTGDNLYRQQIDIDGSCRQEIAGEKIATVARRLVETIGVDRQVVVQAGGDYLDVLQGNKEENIAGAYKTSTSKNRMSNVGGDRADMIMRDWTLSAGRNMRITTSGDMLLSKPGDKAVMWNVSNGSFVLDIGNPLNLDTVKPLSGMDVTSWMGDIKFHTMGPAGTIVLDTMRPVSSVMLGSIMGVAPFHAVLFEQLSAFCSALISYIDTHIHPTGVGPSGVPAVPSASVLSGLIQPMMSLKVLIGA